MQAVIQNLRSAQAAAQQQGSHLQAALVREAHLEQQVTSLTGNDPLYIRITCSVSHSINKHNVHDKNRNKLLQVEAFRVCIVPAWYVDGEA